MTSHVKLNKTNLKSIHYQTSLVTALVAQSNYLRYGKKVANIAMGNPQPSKSERT